MAHPANSFASGHPSDQEPAALPDATVALIDHIVVRYHEAHRRELPELVELARKVEAVHADHEEAPHGLSQRLDDLLADLDRHMKTEEEVLLFAAAAEEEAIIRSEAIAMMRQDHDRHIQAIREMEAITGGFRPPDGACRSWRALYAGVDALSRRLLEHIRIENEVLFPQFCSGRG